MRTLSVLLLLITMLPMRALGGAEGCAPPSAKDAIRKGVAFLTADAKRWMAERAKAPHAANCVSCHHPTLGIWALNEAKRRGHAIDDKFLTEMKSWALATYKKRNPDAGAETRQGYTNSTLEGTYLAFALGSGPLPKREHREILEHLLRRVLAMQEPDGSWKPFGYWAPLIDKQYFNTTWTYLALSSHEVSEKTKGDLAAGRAKALKWLEANPPEDHHQAVIARLLLWKRLGKPQSDAEPLLRQLTAGQNPDGGWSQTPKMGSDALATGQTLYVFGLAGKNTKDAHVQKARDFLRRTQRLDGSWPMISRPPARGKPTDNLMPIVYAGTAWATLGLLGAADTIPP